MRERPILFSGPMVRAILEGRKTQTRRVVKGGPWERVFHDAMTDAFPPPQYLATRTDGTGLFLHCPYGAPGDRLWVRETWRPEVAHSHGIDACDCGDVNVRYDADGEVRHFRDRQTDPAWTLPQAAKTGNVPSIHMPRWASRITLEVTGVRVERLHDISEEDVKAEGVEGGPAYWLDYDPKSGLPHVSARDSFRSLWHSINGPESWDANPWVWAVEFRRVQP